MATRYFRITVESRGRQYVATGDVSSTAQRPEQLAQRRAMNAIYKRFEEELDGAALGVISVEEVRFPVAAFRVMTDEERVEQRRRVLIYRLAQEAAVDPMAKLLARYERYRDVGGYAAAAEALAWDGEGAMLVDLRRSWARSLLNELKGAGAVKESDDETDIGGYVVADAAGFDAHVERFTKLSLEKALDYGSRSSGLHGMKYAMEREAAAWFYETLVEKR